LPASEEGQEEVVKKANNNKLLYNISYVTTPKRWLDKGLEKDHLTDDLRIKYFNPGHSEGKILNDKSNKTQKSKTIIHVVPYSKTSSFKKPIDDQYSGTNNLLAKGFVRMIIESVIDELE